MLARMRWGFGGMTAVAVIVLALWIWTRSEELAMLLAAQPLHPKLELWSVRCCAVAAAAGAQWLLLSGVVCAFYDQRPADNCVRAFAGFIGSMALFAALALALAGR